MINLHYCLIDDTEIKKEFKTTKAIIKWFNANIINERPKGTIFLLTSNSDKEENSTDIFVFEKSYKINEFFKTIEAHVNSLYKKDVFLQEYKSYEAAYEVALSMREPNEFCYD